jgi:hypothetical protein
MQPGARTYLEFPGPQLLTHYTDLRDGGWGLVFTPAFREAHLPGQGTDEFLADILDRTDGKIYRVPMYVAYEEGREGALDEEYNWVDDLDSLQGYFYCCHCCSCHRKTYAKSAGADTDEECEGNRFAFQQITYPNLPGLIHYSETMTDEELEATLVDPPEP